MKFYIVSDERAGESGPLKEIPPPACDWCRRPATHKDCREIDEMVTSTVECDRCANLDTGFLLEQGRKNPKGKR